MLKKNKNLFIANLKNCKWKRENYVKCLRRKEEIFINSKIFFLQTQVEQLT